jgi:hypothetical protein
LALPAVIFSNLRTFQRQITAVPYFLTVAAVDAGSILPRVDGRLTG